MNARFWVYRREGWVKLTLRPGETITLFDGGYTDEGWYRQHTEYSHTEEGVLREITSESLDCDGRFDTAWDCYCPLSELRSVEPAYPEEGVMAPAWESLEHSHRDYAAEAAGY